MVQNHKNIISDYNLKAKLKNEAVSSIIEKDKAL